MRDGTEGVRADHVQESLDKFAAGHIFETVHFTQTHAHFCSSCENGSQLLHSSHADNADFAHATNSLIGVDGLVGGQVFRPEHNDVVVEHVGEEGRNVLEHLVFLTLEKVFLLLVELVDNSCEQVQRIRHILLVCVLGPTDRHQPSHSFCRSQQREEVFFLSEVNKNGMSVESCLDVVTVFG